MEQKKLSVFLLVLCAGSAHGMRLLHDVDNDYGRDFAFGSSAAAAGAEAETVQRDASLDDYEDEIGRVEFEPERGTSYAATVAAAAPDAAAGPASGPATVGSDATTARPGTGSMKWWLPPSTMPSFPLFPNPGGMPGMPLPAMPVPMPMPMPGGIPGMPAMPNMPMPGAIPAGGGMPGMPLPGMPAPFNFKPTGWGAGAGASAGTASSPPAQAQPAPPAASGSSSSSDSANDNPNPTETIIN